MSWGIRAIVAVLAFLSLLPQASFAQVNETRRVLILNDLGIVSSPGFAEVDQAIFTGLQESPFQVELYQESLEITLFPDEDYRRHFREDFIRKYSARKPNVIIAAGSESLKFLFDSNEKIIRETPIIFCAVIGNIPQHPRHDAHFTGVLAALHPQETLSAALRLKPDTKQVVVVGGSGQLDKYFESAARQAFRAYESKLEITYLTDLSMPALLRQLEHLPNDTIVYHTAFTQDATGAHFIDSAQAVPLIAKAANAPVFVMDDVDFRAGAVGGDLVNWADDARVAAAMAVRVLNGEKPESIPIASSRDAYMFDGRALGRWKLKENNLPAGSIVFNRQLTFWEAYQRYILAGILVFLTQTAIIAGLLFQIRKRKRAEVSVRESEKRFRLVANSSPIMIWMSAPDKLCTFFNQRWLEFTGRSMEAELGNGWASAVHPADLERCFYVYSHAFDARVDFEMEYRLRRYDGKYRWVNDTGVPRFEDDKTFQGYIGTCFDITDRRRAEETLLDMSGRLITAHEEERARIARELHDDLSQRMALLQIGLEEFEGESRLSETARQSLHTVSKLAGEISTDLHGLSHELHPSKLDTLGLVASVDGYCREFSKLHGIRAQFVHHQVDGRIPKDVALCLYRIVQEALRNVLKHSGAVESRVELSGNADRIDLCVSDNGAGFDPEAVSPRAGIGWISMRERLRLVGGHLSVESKPEHGTRIYARVPLAVTGESPLAKIGHV